METVAEMGNRALSELGACLARIDEKAVADLIEIIASAKRICNYACGREGLMMRALCMRLYHLGLDVHMVGDMTTPPVGPGDLLLVSAGPGNISTVQALIGQARRAGAKTACFTASRHRPWRVMKPRPPRSCRWAASTRGRSSFSTRSWSSGCASGSARRQSRCAPGIPISNDQKLSVFSMTMAGMPDCEQPQLQVQPTSAKPSC